MISKNNNKNILIFDIFARPTSWDPLDFDQSNNIHIARMLYSPPLLVDTTGNLSSILLSEFSLSEDKTTIHFKLKEGLYYEDGSPITIEDLHFAILRMLYVRPQFPVIDAILGKETWLKSANPLKNSPEGLIIDGQGLTIKFSHKQRKALFRFALELFSVLPKRCFNQDTGKMICHRGPESGLYKFASDDSLTIKNQDLVFKARSKQDHLPQEVLFKYNLSDEQQTHLLESKDNVVVYTSTLKRSKTDPQFQVKNVTVQLSPKARIAALMLNFKHPAFKTKTQRQQFVDSYRLELKNKSGDLLSSIENSLFTELMPAYKSYEPKIEKAKITINNNNIEVKNFFASVDKPFIESFVSVCNKTNLNCSFEKNQSGLIKDYDSGIVASFINKTGFWAVDVVSDLKMLFTPNLHDLLRQVWQDKELLRLIDQAYASEDDSTLEKNLRIVDEYIQDQALFNVVAHFQWAYISNNSHIGTNLSQAISDPHPWHLFYD
ncbi:MAG: ABC transporter substrate-binding protein [Pseudobdellovibrionaceae bacterium]